MAGNNKILAKITNFGTSTGQPDNIGDFVIFYYCSGNLTGPISGEVTLQADFTLSESNLNVALKIALVAYLNPLIFPSQDYASVDVILNASRLSFSIMDNVVRAIDSSTYTISQVFAARYYYCINVQCTASIGSASDGKVLFQYSVDGGANWISQGELENSNTVTLAVVLNSVTKQTAILSGEVPANALCRLVPTSAGTTLITYIRGTEVIY